MPAAGRGQILERSIEQGTLYDERSDKLFQQERVREAAELLGCASHQIRHWASNRNADLYMLDAGDRRILLKILVSKPSETLDCEYESLVELDRISRDSSRFVVPRPVERLEGGSSYLMEFIEGESLDARLRAATSSDDSAKVVADCGRAFADVHRAWRDGDSTFDLDALALDLDRLPWSRTPRDRKRIERALRHLEGRSVSVARLYLDCDPVNVLIRADGRLVLIDPPERSTRDAVTWDLGAFLFGIRRIAWKRPTSAMRLRRERRRMRDAFLEGYAEGSPNAEIDRDRVMLALGELVRLAQLWVWWLRPMGFRHRATGLVRSAYAYPLLIAARSAIHRELDDALGDPADV